MALLVDIEKRLGAFRLRMRFEADRGVLALLGASGCGKSMTLKCIAGVERPDAGRIVLDGRTLFDSERHIDLPPQKRRVGYLFQQYALFPNMTVEGNIAAGRKGRGGGGPSVREMVKTMRLEGLEGKRPHQLSGGQQQRVALARILINQPELLLLDEPFSALDSHLRFQLEEELRRVIRSFGGTVLLVSHDRDEVFRLSGRVAVLGEGHIETIGTREEVFRRPGTRNGAILTGCKNLSALRSLGGRRGFAADWGIPLTLPGEAGEAEYVGIRMHDVRPGGGENGFVCQVVEEIENPFSFTVMLRPLTGEGGVPLGMELDKERWRSLRRERVEVHLPEQAILLLKDMPGRAEYEKG